MSGTHGIRSVIHACFALAGLIGVSAHDAALVTHSFAGGAAPSGPRLALTITHQATDRLVAARFSVIVDGAACVPEWLDEHGLRFTSNHHSKKEFFTACYARGTGSVGVSLPAGAREVEVTVTRGFEYIPATASGRVEKDRLALQLNLRQWIDLSAEGWVAVDEHLHYDRLDPTTDPNWLTMLDADGLAAGHFMTLKGGMMAGTWARQFAYGRDGQATDRARLIVPGEEYRDPLMGHVNLLGVDRLIEPISTGGYGVPATAENFPPLHDVLLAARDAGGVTGVAHGGTLGRQPTAVADAILGAVDFWELSNGFIYSTDTWYRLLNCGFVVPPAAGTDLPNSPFRDPWQPMLGSVRTYVRTNGRTDFGGFKSALAAGRVFITGGPIIEFTVNGKGPGETVTLPPDGGEVTIEAVLRSPRPLHALRVVHNGRALDATPNRTTDGPIHRLTLQQRVTLRESGWLAAEGRGDRIAAQKIDAMAHTGAVQVLVGDRPIRSREDLGHLAELLARQRAFYLAEARYRTEADRGHMSKIFDRALAELRARSAQVTPSAP